MAGAKGARFRHYQTRRRARCRTGAARRAAPAREDDGAAYLVDVAWRGIAVRTRRRRTPQAADVGGGSSGSGSADLSARSRLPNRPPAVRAKRADGPKAAPAAVRALGHPQINLSELP